MAVGMLSQMLGISPAHAACTVSISGVAFGNYNSASADSSAGSVTLGCHPSDHSPEIAISPGSSNSFAQRQMSSGSSVLEYNLYTASSHMLVWGDGSGGTVTVSPTGSVSAGTRTFRADIHGLIPAGQTVPPGSYSDQMVVTVSF